MKPLVARLRSLVHDREQILIWLVMGAAICSVVYYGRERATDSVNYVILVALGIAAVGYCVVGSANATRAWFERRLLRCLLWVAVVAVAMLWETNAHLGVGSANQDALSAARVAGFEARADARAVVNAKADRVLSLKRDAAWTSDVPAPDVLAPKIQAAMAHKFYRVTTGNCTVTKGPETTKFCQDLRQLEADLAMAQRKDRIAGELAVAERELEQARAAAGAVKTVTTADRADARNIRKVAAWAGVTDYDAELSNAALFVLAMLVFMSLTEVLRIAREFDGQPRQPWGIGATMRKLRHFLIHGEWRDTSVTYNITNHNHNPALQQWAQTPEVRKLMGA